jgi:phospholipid/cholesterol/gamma-HCH transport system ATP-binding protein
MEIEVQDLHKSFDGQAVLAGLTLTIAPGKITLIIGGSGTGKSVFLKHLIGLMQPDAGTIRIDGREITALSERDLLPIRQRIGMLFQGGALLASIPLGENVMLGLLENGMASRDQAEAKAREKLTLVALERHFDKMPDTLSGGMRKRGALARALMMDPECILYDEPTAGLDPPRARRIEELILDVNRTLGTTSIVVTHDMDSVRRLADHVYMLHAGRVIFSGTRDELFASADPVVREFTER